MPDKHYVTVKAAVQKGDKLLLQREWREKVQQYVWDLPGGRIDAGEDILIGLKREVQEEIGVDLIGISDLPVAVWSVKGGSDGVVALLYRARVSDENFVFDKTNNPEVEEASWLDQKEFDKTPDFVHKPFIQVYFNQMTTDEA